MEMLQGVWKQHLRPRAVVGYGVKIFVPSPPNYVTRTPGQSLLTFSRSAGEKNILQTVWLSFFQCLFLQCPPK